MNLPFSNEKKSVGNVCTASTSTIFTCGSWRNVLMHSNPSRQCWGISALNTEKLFRMHYQRSHSNSFHCIAFDLMLTNDMITLTKCRNQWVWYGSGQTNWIQMEMCIDFYLHSNHRQLVEPIYASFFPFLYAFSLLLLLLLVLSVWWWEGKPSEPFCFGGKKNPMILFPLQFFYLVLVQLQSNKYIVTQITEK